MSRSPPPAASPRTCGGWPGTSRWAGRTARAPSRTTPPCRGSAAPPPASRRRRPPPRGAGRHREAGRRSPGAPSRASASTATPSSVTWPSRVVRSIPVIMETPSLRAEAGTRKSESPSGGLRRHEHRVGDRRPGHELLQAGQHPAAAAALGPRGRRLRVPVQLALHQGQGGPRAAVGDGGQPAVLLGRAACGEDGVTSQHGGQVRARIGGPAQLVEEDGRLDHAEPAPAVLLGQRETEPAELRHLLPERLALAARVVEHGPHERRLAVLVEEGARGILQELLIGAEREIHGAPPTPSSGRPALPWAGRARARR